MTFSTKQKILLRRLLHITTLTALTTSTALLVACGGGGAGEPNGLIEPPNPAANATLLFMTQVVTSSSGSKSYEGTSKQVDYGAKAHLDDVGVVAGATGEGTSIMVIDDFDAPKTATVSFPNVSRKIKYRESINSYTAFYNLTYTLPIQFTHGQLVADIAGGTRPPETLVKVLINEASNQTDLVSCTIAAELIKLNCPSNYQADAPDSTRNATLRIQAIPGVAPQALVLTRKVDLSSAQDVDTTYASIHGHLRNSVGSSMPTVINLSLGSGIATTGKSAAEVMAVVERFPLQQKSDAVITVAAGNSGAPCNDTDLNGCNAIAVAMAIQPETQDVTLVVGALTGPVGAQRMAVYSTSAGFLADRYILASGDTGWSSEIQGTSFAAPRVAGVAAILKQKFPQLTAVEIASIILQSADKDMNNDGKPDFEGVDPIFGHGKLSLSNALKRAASL